MRIGKVGHDEVDFVAEGKNGVEYYQTALSVRDVNTLQRELKSLDSISDHNPKYLLTLDEDPLIIHNGIRQINALDWLLANKPIEIVRHTPNATTQAAITEADRLLNSPNARSFSNMDDLRADLLSGDDL